MKKYIRKHGFELVMLFSIFASLFMIFSEPDTQISYVRHTVQPGECVWEVAEKYSGQQIKPMNEFSWMISKENGLEGKVVQPGDSLLIPLVTYVK